MTTLIIIAVDRDGLKAENIKLVAPGVKLGAIECIPEPPPGNFAPILDATAAAVGLLDRMRKKRR
jgi:hypothetical protein